jgi:hypothetical protein
MLKMTDLMERTADTGEHRFPITEVFFKERTGHLRYVALHTGDAFDHDDTLVSIGRFSPLRDGDWEVWLPESDIRSAPGWDSGDPHPHHVPVALEAWPPILVGPFGHTTSPLMFYAAMVDAEDSTEPPEQPHRSSDPRVDRLERVTRRLGAEVFGSDGPLGRLDDMLVAPTGFTITDLIVDGRQVPYGHLRHMAEEGTHTVLNADRPTFEGLPRLDADA